MYGVRSKVAPICYVNNFATAQKAIPNLVGGDVQATRLIFERAIEL